MVKEDKDLNVGKLIEAKHILMNSTDKGIIMSKPYEEVSADTPVEELMSDQAKALIKHIHCKEFTDCKGCEDCVDVVDVLYNHTDFKYTAEELGIAPTTQHVSKKSSSLHTLMILVGAGSLVLSYMVIKLILNWSV